MSRPPAVLLAALGDRAALLRRETLDYVSASGAGKSGVVRGAGVFDIAGSRLGWLMRIVRPFAGPNLVVTRHEAQVPFTVVNRHSSDAGGPVLSAVRTLHFRGRDECFSDVLLAGPEPGTLRNLLGDRRRIELILSCAVTDDGGFVLRSRAASLRIGRARMTLPALLGISVEVVHGYDERTRRHTIAARASNPMLGTVLEYRGSFA